MYDIIIVGSGPAGLTAAIYARRAGKTVLVLEKETFGGQMTFSPKVENYPGFLQTSGNELAELLVEQALALGAEIELDSALSVSAGGESVAVCGESTVYECRALIIAAGSKHRQLGLANENELIGAGVSYCAVCDGAFYAGKRVAIVGGGNTALQEAVLLSETCAEVVILQDLPRLTGEQALIAQLRQRKNVRFVLGVKVTGLLGTKELHDVELTDESGKKAELAVDGVFVAIGQAPENAPFTDVCELSENGYIIADESCETSTPGVFAAGDCRTKVVRQITTATGDGAAAAIAACRYIDSL